MTDSPILFGLYVPPHPHPLLAPEKNEGWGKLRQAFDTARKRIEESDADIILIYSTTWPSVIGHQIQARSNPEWVHVDDDFHYLGSMPYKFEMDSDFSHQYHVVPYNDFSDENDIKFVESGEVNTPCEQFRIDSLEFPNDDILSEYFSLNYFRTIF